MHVFWGEQPESSYLRANVIIYVYCTVTERPPLGPLVSWTHVLSVCIPWLGEQLKETTAGKIKTGRDPGVEQ